MEFWNLVLTQFDAHEDGTYTELEHKNVDTGMGLERMATIMQGVDSIFDVDTVKYIRDVVCQKAGVEYGKEHKIDVSVRIITDHIRSVTIMTADGFPRLLSPAAAKHIPSWWISRIISLRFFPSRRTASIRPLIRAWKSSRRIWRK